MAATLASVWYGGELIAAAQDLTEEFHQTYPLAEKGAVSLDNINGAVHITAWDRPEVKVDAVKHAKTAEYLKKISIEVKADNDSVRIQTRLPDSTPGQNQSGRVEYQVMVPSQARLDKVSNVNGAIELKEIGGDTKASTVNGALTAHQVSGSGSYNSVNGSIEVMMSKADFSKGLALETVNGKMALSLPANANAHVKVDTLNGSIHTDFDLVVKKNFPVGKNLEGQLGNGGPPVKLHSVNGSIQIKKAGSASAK
jgi:DUF4097 and DUF4098 domain-containing protein YvlB